MFDLSFFKGQSERKDSKISWKWLLTFRNRKKDKSAVVLCPTHSIFFKTSEYFITNEKLFSWPNPIDSTKLLPFTVDHKIQIRHWWKRRRFRLIKNKGIICSHAKCQFPINRNSSVRNLQEGLKPNTEWDISYFFTFWNGRKSFSNKYNEILKSGPIWRVTNAHFVKIISKESLYLRTLTFHIFPFLETFYFPSTLFAGGTGEIGEFL